MPTFSALAGGMLGGDDAVACLHLGGSALLAPSSPLSLSFTLL